MPLYMDNYKFESVENQSYQDFHQTCPQNRVKKDYMKRSLEHVFDVPVNYCPYLIFEVNNLIKDKLNTNCFQMELEMFCLYDNQSFTISLSSKSGPLSVENIFFELEKYMRKLSLNNPISSVKLTLIESTKKIKLVHTSSDNRYNVFTTMNYKESSEDVYLGLVKLDLDTRN